MSSRINDIRVALEANLVENLNWFLYTGTWRAGGNWFDNQAWPTGETIPDADLPNIAWPSVPYTPTAGTPYLQVTFAPVTRRPVTAGPSPEQRHSGLFLVNVCTPEGLGADAGARLADKLCQRFEGSSSILAANVIVRIEYSEAKRPLHEPPFYVIPVEISWFSYVS